MSQEIIAAVRTRNNAGDAAAQAVVAAAFKDREAGSGLVVEGAAGNEF